MLMIPLETTEIRGLSEISQIDQSSVALGSVINFDENAEKSRILSDQPRKVIRFRDWSSYM